MLISNFYKKEKSNLKDEIIIFTIKLNPNHEVYQGHFPQQAVVPGVIQLQIAKELLEENLKLKLMMDDISQVKYLKPIIPEQNSELIFEITIKDKNESAVKANISVTAEETIFTKAKINFSINK